MRNGTETILSQGDGAPNLDGQSAEDLREFAKDVTEDVYVIALAMFPTQPPDYLDACDTLGAYAVTKAIAMEYRAAGNIAQAIVLEAACERLYNLLPKFARW